MIHFQHAPLSIVARFCFRKTYIYIESIFECECNVNVDLLLHSSSHNIPHENLINTKNKKSKLHTWNVCRRVFRLQACHRMWCNSSLNNPEKACMLHDTTPSAPPFREDHIAYYVVPTYKHWKWERVGAHGWPFKLMQLISIILSWAMSIIHACIHRIFLCYLFQFCLPFSLLFGRKI